MRGWSHLAALALLSGAAAASGLEPEDRIVDFAADDAEMNAAKSRGSSTLPDFYRHLAKPARDESDFMVKFDIDPTAGVEYVWADDLVRGAGELRGKLINQPVQTDHKLGDVVTIREADIVDWAYRRAGVMQGSFTTRVMLDRMPAEEAAEYRAYLGW